MTENPHDVTTPGRGRLRRSRADRMVSGVCAGLARQLGVDPLLVRAAVVALTFFSGGAAVVAYLIAWVLIPQDAASSEPLSESARRERSRTDAIDAALSSLGDRLRDPEVRTGARRAAAGLSAAVGAGVDGLASRTRRNSAGPDTPPVDPPAPGTPAPGTPAPGTPRTVTPS